MNCPCPYKQAHHGHTIYESNYVCCGDNIVYGGTVADKMKPRVPWWKRAIAWAGNFRTGGKP